MVKWPELDRLWEHRQEVPQWGISGRYELCFNVFNNYVVVRIRSYSTHCVCVTRVQWFLLATLA